MVKTLHGLPFMAPLPTGFVFIVSDCGKLICRFRIADYSATGTQLAAQSGHEDAQQTGGHTVFCSPLAVCGTTETKAPVAHVREMETGQAAGSCRKAPPQFDKTF